MSDTPPTVIDDLLRHAGFLRALARELVPGADEDLHQEVWLASLRTPPQHAGAPRGWLATLARRLASNARREDRRRRMREAAVAHPASAADDVPSPPEVLAREELRARIVRAVLSLDPPFRDALLLRFYEELEPRDIARRLGIPPATVRTRIARGLHKLRAQLDASHGGDRAQWTLSLAPWLRTPEAASVLPVLAMKKLAVCALVLAFVVAGWHLATPTASVHTARSAGAATPGPSAPASGATVADRGAEITRTAIGTRGGAAVDVARAAPVFPAARRSGLVVGEVVDADGDLVADVEVVATPDTGPLPRGLVIRDDRTEVARTRTDVDGRFRLDAVAEGPARVTARHLTGSAHAVVIVSAVEPAGPLRMELDADRSPRDLEVLVVDAAGAPVPDARVEVFAWTPQLPDIAAAERSRTEPAHVGRTAADGILRARGFAGASGVAVARAPDGRVGAGTLSATQDQPHVTVTVADAGAVHGRLTGIAADRLAGATLSLHQLATFHAYRVSGGRRIDLELHGDRFAFEDLPAGTYGFTLDAPRAAEHGARILASSSVRVDSPRANSIAMPRVEVAAGAVADAVLTLTGGGAVHGTVTRDGRPAAGASVTAVLAPRTSNYPAGFIVRGAHVWRLDGRYENAPHNPISHLWTRTDAAGRYSLTGLAPGRYRVEVAAPALSYDRRLDVAVEDGEAVELEHALTAAGVLQTAVLGASYLGVIAEGETDPTMLAIVDHGFATFPGLAPGRYTVARFHSDADVAPVRIGSAEVVAGRTTWVDLRAASVRCVVTGRVLAGDRPAPDARVTLYPTTVLTGRDGRFRIEVGHPIRPRALLKVRLGGLEYSWRSSAEGPVTALDATVQLGDAWLTFAVVDADGLPVPAGVEFEWEGDVAATGGLQAARGTATIDAAGHARLGPFPPGVVGGTVDRDGLRVRFTSSVPRADVLRVVSPAVANLRVRVTKDGEPAGRCLVTANTWLGDGPPPDTDDWRAEIASAVRRTDEDGSATLTVAAGHLVVYASEGGFMGRHSTLQRVHIAPGRTLELAIAID